LEGDQKIEQFLLIDNLSRSILIIITIVVLEIIINIKNYITKDEHLDLFLISECNTIKKNLKIHVKYQITNDMGKNDICIRLSNTYRGKSI